MEFISNIPIFFLNALIVLYFYLQLYFWQIVLASVMVFCFIIELKNKSHHYVNDDRAVI